MAGKVADRALIPPFLAMEVMRLAREKRAQGADLVHLEIGQPWQGLPQAVLERLGDALRTDPMGYTLALGLPALRERIAAHYAEVYGAAVTPEQVVLTVGSSGAFLLSFLSAFAPGDRVAVSAPGYPCYRHILSAVGVQPVGLAVDASTRYQPTVEHLRVAMADGPLAGLIIASPANPTGTVIPPETLRDLIAFCDANGLWLISDEIYHGIVHGGPPVATAAGTSPSVIVVNSFSKYYRMTGWRLGWMVLPPALLRPVECLAQNMFIAAPTPSQHAALLVFDHVDDLEQSVAGYRASRDLLMNELPGAGFPALAPADGAFYLYADVAHLTNDSVAFCKRMLDEVGVATTPGVDFDEAQGGRFLRFSYAGPEAAMREAIVRLRSWRK